MDTKKLSMGIKIAAGAMIAGGSAALVPTKGNLTTNQAKVGAMVCVGGFLLLGAYYTGALGSLYAAINNGATAEVEPEKSDFEKEKEKIPTA